MGLYKTDGSTARVMDGMVIWSQAESTTATSHVDIEYSSARTAGYGFFILQLTGVECNANELLLTPMSAANTVVTNGCYGGYYAHGEGNGDITAYDASFNNRRGFPISALRAGNELGNYLGHYTVNISDPTNTGSGNAYPNVWWHGTHRINNALAANVAGAGVHNRFNAHYGLRLETVDHSNNRILEYGYTLYALKAGT